MNFVKMRQQVATDRIARIDRQLADIEPWRDLLVKWKAETEKALEDLDANPSSRDRHGNLARDAFMKREELLGLLDDIVLGQQPTSSGKLVELAEEAGVKRRQGWPQGNVTTGRFGLNPTQKLIDQLHRERERHRADLKKLEQDAKQLAQQEEKVSS